MAEGFIGKLGSIFGVTEEEYEDEYDEEIEEAEETQIASGQGRTSAAQASSVSVSKARSNNFVQPKMESHGGKVLSMQNSTAGAGLQAQTAKKQQFRLVITEPKSFNDCPRMVDSLRTRRPVIINVEHLERETARKIFDFLSGATYAINGKVQKISDNIFVFAPENVDVLAVQSGEEGREQGRTVREAPWRR
ncbi:MAG: cell division protein SepF [Anaerovoracaceae bacterium]|nr:cell division protein SepF [Bacillota bacterium]MDY2670886.1 cell division protein SepF [Anaerovoracaceae bacterium]